MPKTVVDGHIRDVDKLIRNTILKYITNPSSIILAVTPGTEDLFSSEDLKLVREVDPEGLRTIGALTKIDLMDAGTDVVDILAGRGVPLRLGYVPVTSHGQQEDGDGKSMASVLEAERAFFESHPAYKGKAQYCGTPYLARRLNEILLWRIKKFLPDIKQRLDQQQNTLDAELKTLNDGYGGFGYVVLTAITEFTSELRTVIDGSTNRRSPNESSDGLRLSRVFHELYQESVHGIDASDQVSDSDIRTILYSCSGSTPALFVGTAAFELIVKHQIRRLHEPSANCVQRVYDEFIHIIDDIFARIPTLNRYPVLKTRFKSISVPFLETAMASTSKFVTELVKYVTPDHSNRTCDLPTV